MDGPATSPALSRSISLSRMLSLASRRRSKASQALSFASPEISRGTPVNRILARAGQVLQNSGGDAVTYALSEQTERLHTFISHNWSTARLLKFLVLALNFNFGKAIAAVCVMGLTSFALNLFGVMPTRCINSADEAWCIYPVSTLFYPVVLSLALLHGHEVARCLSCQGQLAFLDKTCIHQVDPVVKEAGIKSLGAFLQASDHMLIVYSDVYMQKLWTIYELAVFLIMNQQDAVISLIPASFPLVLLAMTTIFWISELTFWVRRILLATFPAQMMNIIVIFLGCTTATVLFRWWAKERALMWSRMANFEFRSASCFCEDDREYVQGNIVQFMRLRHLVDDRSSDDAALDVFDRFVRGSMPKILDASLGPIGIPYRYIIVPFCIFLMPAVDLMGLNLHDRAPDMIPDIFRLVRMLGMVFGVWPFAAGLLSQVMSLKQHWRGLKEVLLVLGSAFIGAITTFAYAELISFLAAARSVGATIALVVCAAVPIVMALWIFGSHRVVYDLEFLGANLESAREHLASSESADLEVAEPSASPMAVQQECSTDGSAAADH